MNTKTKVVNAYLNFDGRCEEALEFYKKALGAEVDAVMRMKDSPEQNECTAGKDNFVMHSSFRVGDSVIMASDCRCEGKPAFQGFSLSLSAGTDAEATQLFNALADGGKVEMPLGKTFWSPCFGVVADRFGVSWMVIVLAEGCGTTC